MSIQSVTSADSYQAIEAQMSNASAQAEGAKQGIIAATAQKDFLARTGEVSESLNMSSQPNNHHAQSYGNMLLDSVGLAGVGEMFGFLGSALKGETSFRGVKTLNSLKGKSKGKSIKTKEMGKEQDLLCRSKMVGDFNKNSDSGKMSGHQQMAGLNNQIQQMQAVLSQNQLALGMGNQAKQVKGHEQFSALKGPGMAPAHLALDIMRPKGPTEDISSDIKSDDGTTSWA